MILSSEVKEKILENSRSWYEKQYGSLSKEERKNLGAFYTPGEIVIEMIEKFDCDSLSGRKILDPCCGSGNLLVGCILAGADPKKIYGNEFNADMVNLCRERLKEFGVPKDNIHQGDATDSYCLSNFGKDYTWPRQMSLFGNWWEN